MAQAKSSMKRPGLIMVIIIILAGIATIILDQATKIGARENLKGVATEHYLGGFINTEYRENDGAFLGMGGDWPPFLKVIFLIILPMLVCLGGIVWLFLSKKLYLSDRLSIMIILAGGLSNLWDRVLFGKVTDFIYFALGDFKFTGIVNFADMSVFFGVLVLLAFSIIRSIREKKNKKAE